MLSYSPNFLKRGLNMNNQNEKNNLKNEIPLSKETLEGELLTNDSEDSLPTTIISSELVKDKINQFKNKIKEEENKEYSEEDFSSAPSLSVKQKIILILSILLTLALLFLGIQKVQQDKGSSLESPEINIPQIAPIENESGTALLPSETTHPFEYIEYGNDWTLSEDAQHLNTIIRFKKNNNWLLQLTIYDSNKTDLLYESPILTPGEELTSINLSAPVVEDKVLVSFKLLTLQQEESEYQKEVLITLN